ncbi:xanthine dehydrogenase family protein molybdopterin-binding subunit [Glacieibacterium frigidum]|uniref:xanthine dehydrogenase family protein molybdopterin-binding subunit n=1 Tax=Glacieibacterium frigidum TaxID=2593303 RepID=UPI001F40295C|nr:molybdopterin cofactor-binding domain-containing protein [Glacieibacterium frigidum]
MARSDPEPSPAPRRGLTRRRLLIGGGIGVGLVVGYAAWPRDRALNWATADGETLLNGWVKVGADGRVTVAVPQAEMGQGVFTSLPQILADELGADWATVGVEPAPLHPIYANKGMALDAVEAMPAALRGVGGWAMGALIERFDMQMTGGSTSVRGFHDTVRLAGAAARELLCRAAARDWGVDWTECEAKGGFVTYKANRARFAELAAKASAESAPSPTLRPVASRTLAGRSVPRLDIPSKVDGSARFGADVRLPGMKYASVRSGPAGDPALVSATAPAGVRLVKGPTWVAAVADTFWGAKTGLDKVTATFAKRARPAGPWIEPALRAAIAKPGEVVGGDAVEFGAGTLTADYSVPFAAHACMEPMTATARVGDGRAEVWTPTQSITLTAWAVAKALGIDEGAVTVHPTLLGGGFGRKAEADVAVQAALIARATNAPVQLIWTREEDFAQDRFRPAAAARMQGRVKVGRIDAWGSRVAIDCTGASFMRRNLPAMGGDGKAGASAVDGTQGLPYAVPSFVAEHAYVDTAVPLGFWRSVGHSFSGFFVESFVDELAHAANADPGAFRLAMLGDSPRHAAVIRAVLDASGPVGQVEPGVGRGLAVVESFGSVCAQVAEVEVTGTTIKVTRVWAAIDCGAVVNPDIVRAQIEGGIIYGLSAAMSGAISFKDGAVEQRNFDAYPLPGLASTPEIEVLFVPSAGPLGGVGEPGTPPIAPAVGNAIFAATGKRLRDLPFALA